MLTEGLSVLKRISGHHVESDQDRALPYPYRLTIHNHLPISFEVLNKVIE